LRAQLIDARPNPAHGEHTEWVLELVERSNYFGAVGIAFGVLRGVLLPSVASRRQLVFRVRVEPFSVSLAPAGHLALVELALEALREQLVRRLVRHLVFKLLRRLQDFKTLRERCLPLSLCRKVA